MGELLDKMKVPAGSLIVDTALVIALLVGQAKMTEQITGVQDRVNEIEQGHIRSNTDARVLVLEQRANQAVTSQAEFKAEVRTQLDRIETKLDRIYEAR